MADRLPRCLVESTSILAAESPHISTAPVDEPIRVTTVACLLFIQRVPNFQADRRVQQHFIFLKNGPKPIAIGGLFNKMRSSHGGMALGLRRLHGSRRIRSHTRS